MQLDKSERLKHKYGVRKTTYNHIAFRFINFFKKPILVYVSTGSLLTWSLII